jgi:lipopolysaccharide assembly outer membrane protein LptD (OstA)
VLLNKHWFQYYVQRLLVCEDGYQFRIPYYFNLAPNRDFLLTLNQLTTRGSVIEGKYRQF